MNLRQTPLRMGAVWLGAACLLACSPERPLGRQELKRNFLRSDALEIHTRSGAAGALGRLAERLALEMEQRGKLPLAPEPMGAGDTPNPKHARLCIGLSDDPEWMGWLKPLGVSALEGGGFRWQDLDHRSPGDALVACLPDPERSGLPLVLILGVEAEALARRQFMLPAPWIPRIQTWRDGAAALEAEFEIDGSLRQASLRSWVAAQERLMQQPVRALDAQLSLRAAPSVSAERLQHYAERCLEARAFVEREFSGRLEQAIEIRAYGHTEEMQLALGSVQLSRLDRAAGVLHVLLAEGLVDDGAAGLARASALALAGAPRHPGLLDVLGLLAANSWWGRDLGSWIAHLDGAGMLLESKLAFAPGAEQRYSPHRLLPARAALWRQTHGTGALAKAWGESLPSEALPEWTLWYPVPEVPLSARRKQLRQRPWRGVALYDAPRAFQPSAYGSRAAEQALEDALAVGANAYSMTLQVAEDDPAAWLSGAVGGPWASASDAELGSLLAAGKSRAMGSLLVLDPLLGAGRDRLDQESLNGVEGRRTFFQRLQYFNLHYALLGELLGLDILCMGSSLNQAAATILVEEELEKPVMRQRKPALLKGWKELIARLRAAYGGGLTYAAHMKLPLYQVGFWKQLDFVGMLGFGPQVKDGFQAGGAGVSPETLELEVGRQLRKGLQFIEKTQRPPLFIQLGFPARDGSWDAWTSARGEFDPGSQERFFQAFGEGLRGFMRRGKPVNFFLWNWNVVLPTAPGAVGDFSVRERLTAQTLDALLRSR